MEDIIIHLLRLLAQPLLFLIRIIIYLTWEVMCEKLLWYLGWPVSRAITAGHFPKSGIHEGEQETPFKFFIVALIGLAYPIAIAVLLVMFLNP